MSQSLNPLKEVMSAVIWGATTGVTKGDTASLDYSSCDSGILESLKFTYVFSNL